MRELKEISNRLEALLEKLESFFPQTEPTLYNNDTLAKYLGVTKSILRKMRINGLIQYSQVGNQCFYTKDDVDAFLEKNKMRIYGA